ncbi:hypothetical protein AZF37_08345 [endosymbiont 'TC1' of Trimyema compressum]|nr:DUF3021 family protein [endosymbiont 'TC1' of Trimyema compressum]AMP21165.1 hypothetical protein AZF37_08345 [endosymbiont 'TC1' of Trimyema compressum]
MEFIETDNCSLHAYDSNFLPVSLWAGWLSTKAISIAIYLVIFLLFYIAIWFIQYFYWKHKIKNLNEGVKNSRKGV